MSRNDQPPRALSMVSYLFLLAAIWAVIGIVVRLSRNNLYLDFDVGGFFIFLGLRFYSRFWRGVALLYIGIGMCLGLVAVILALCGPGHVQFSFNLFGAPVFPIPAGLFVMNCIIYLLLQCWMLRVLIRPDIRYLFYRDRWR
jgi:hypothetical protein